MPVDERARHELYEELGTVLTEKSRDTLMDHLPPLGWGDVATKRDLEVLEATLHADIADVRADFAELRGDFRELRGDFGELRGDFGELRGEFTGLRGEFHREMVVQLRWMIATMLTLTALVLAIAVRLH